MAEGKLLEEDKDEWFFHSMKKYSNLYMFEFEFPLDTLEVINQTSLFVSGVQAYSKTCELLQLCVPPKLLQHESEEGLCKDRDFKILSGGYADGRIRQVKFIASSTNLVATYQDGFSGVIVYEAGDDNRATIIEKCRLPTSNPAVAKGKSLCVMNDRILLGTTCKETLSTDQHPGICLAEWKMDNKCTTTASLATTRYIWKTFREFDPGHITKMKQWEQDTCIFLTSRGTLALYDLRTGSEAPDIFFNATKSPNIVSHDHLLSPLADSIIFSFDCVPQRNQIGVLDSCGGYETFDTRFIGKNCHESKAEARTTTTRSTRSRSLLPEFSGLTDVYPDCFNIEYEDERTKARENERIRFIISGLKKECVPVLEENSENTADAASIQSVFTHDGHSKPVTHATWHPASSNLIFSASIDAVLHAWQYIPEKEN